MKKILCILGLSMIFSLPVFADGEIGTGNKSCPTNCIVNPDTQVETTKISATSKLLTEITNDYYSKITSYFIEIAF